MSSQEWERRVILYGLVGALWLSLVATAVLLLAGLTVPTEVYLTGTGIMVRLATLLTIPSVKTGNGNGSASHQTTTGGSAEPPVVSR